MGFLILLIQTSNVYSLFSKKWLYMVSASCLAFGGSGGVVENR